MVSGDLKGTVRVWRTHIGLTPVCTYNREGMITNIVFCSLMINADSTPDTVNSLFFFGSSAGANNGSVCLADDLKNCSEVCKVPGHVKNILFYEKENSVIVITSHLLLVQFKLNLTEKLVPDRKVKLAVAGNPEFLNTIWAGSGLMATVSGENMIRMFNIESDENYVLTLGEAAF
jgi:intraflagellar transport protein 140